MGILRAAGVFCFTGACRARGKINSVAIVSGGVCLRGDKSGIRFAWRV